LQGTNSTAGRRILASSSLDILSAETLQDAADKAVAAAKQGS
jgi:succinyl-CoA synthetase beta subunit